MNTRIKSIFDESGLSQVEIGERLGCSRQTIFILTKPNSNPSSDLLIKIANLFKVNIHWLLTGEGDKSLGKEPETVVKIKEEVTQLREENRQLLTEIVTLYREKETRKGAVQTN